MQQKVQNLFDKFTKVCKIEMVMKQPNKIVVLTARQSAKLLGLSYRHFKSMADRGIFDGARIRKGQIYTYRVDLLKEALDNAFRDPNVE